jgi:hypothetical protein
MRPQSSKSSNIQTDLAMHMSPFPQQSTLDGVTHSGLVPANF